MAAYWLENANPLAAFFKQTQLRHSTPTQLAAYQNARTDEGRAPETINGELSVLRQVLKRAKPWYRFSDEYMTLRNRKPPVGYESPPVTYWLVPYESHDTCGFQSANAPLGLGLPIHTCSS
jgi:hypothetical protein